MRQRILTVVWLLVAACGKDPAAAKIPERCDQDRECPERWKCLAHKCTDPSVGAALTDPEHALTPTRRKEHVDQTNEERAKDVDRKLEKAESE